MSMELLGNEFIEEFYPPPTRTAPGAFISKAWSAFSRGLRRWTPSSIGFTRIRTTRVTSGAKRGGD